MYCVEDNPKDEDRVIPAGEGSTPGLNKSQSGLIDYLFEELNSPIRAPFTAWMAASQRYTSFVWRYKDKIRKKLHITRDEDAAADLMYELGIPYWLLQEQRFQVAYEPYTAEKTRGPDYSVTFRGHFTFNIEVTHIRGLHRTSSARPEGESAIDFRLVDILCSKLRQMPPGMANVLFVVSAAAVDEPLDLSAHIAWIKAKAEHRDPQFYARQGFLDPSDFFRYFERLSGLVLYYPAGAQQVVLWTNPQGRFKLPGGVKNILQALPSS